MLVAASVIGGLGTPVGLVALVLLARDPQVMGCRPISWRLAVAGWIVTVIVAGLDLLFAVQLIVRAVGRWLGLPGGGGSTPGGP
jgi:Mn2+/Fe2+ NRAMP family transporter